MGKRDADSDIEEEEEDDDFPRSEDEDAQDSRFSKLGSKRRKLVRSDDEDDISEEELAEDDDQDADREFGADIIDDAEALEDDEDEADLPTNPTLKTTKILTKSQLEKAQRKAKKSGVIYLSRIPPFMKVHTLKSHLAPYGTLGRVFLTPEPPARYQARVKAGGNKKRSFVDGWVEFESKKKAKICAETLNGNIVGGKKGGWYHDDIWNIKYLKGFKWNDLMEQVQSEEREREGRLRAEIQRNTRERKTFLDNLERAKVDRGMQNKRAKKDDSTTSKADVDLSRPDGPGAGGKRSKVNFRQNAVQYNNPQKAIPASHLSKIF